MSSSTPPPQQHRTPPLVSVSTSGVQNAPNATTSSPSVGSTNVSSSSPLGGATSARGHPHPHASSSAAAARRPTSSSSTGANTHTGIITSTSMASFGQSDTNDVVRVDDDEDMMLDGGDDADERDENEETVLELALSIAVERPSTAEVVVPGIGGRPESATSITSSSTSPNNNNNNHYSRNRSMSFTSNANNGGDSDCGEFSTMIEVGITSEQGARNTMEDRHSARLGDAKAAKHTGAGLVKSTTPHLTSSTSGAASVSPSAAEKASAATSKDVNSTNSSLPLLPPSTAAAAAEVVPLSTTSSDDDDDGSSCGSSSSGVDVGPDHRGVLRTTSTATSEQQSSQHTPPINSTGTDALRGASPKQGTVRGGGGVSAFHRAPSPATRRQREQEQQQERDAAEEVSLKAEVEVMDEDQLAQGIPFFAVYDGHGGTRCASYLRMKLAQLVLSHPKLVTDPEVALHEAILAAEEEYLKLFGETDASGATAAVAMFIGDSLVTANVGDTEMVLCRRGEAILLSEKHTPKDNPAEKQRVIDAGGRIVHGGRVGHPRFNPNVLHVALSRAMGDAPFKLPELTLSKPSGITAIPFTHTTPIHPEDEFVIIGCDGLWDVLTYQEAVDIGRTMLLKDGKSTPAYNLAQSISDALVSKALSAGSSDNVTVLFLLYKQRPRSASHRPPSAIARHWQQHPTANATAPSPSSSPSPALLSISSTPPSARQQ